MFVHAVRLSGTKRSGPLAVCGYPLRAPSQDHHRDERTFEDRWRATSDCCADCAEALDLAMPLATTDEETSGKGHNWVVIGSVATLVPMVGVLLLRVAAAALR